MLTLRETATILAALQYFGLLRPLVGKLFKGKKA